MEAQSSSRLVLELNNRQAQLCQLDAANGEVLTLGKGDTNELVCDGEFTSRQHAYIEVHRDCFYLVDASSNGTFVQTEDEQIRYVHRDKLRLWGVGWISLGEPLHVKQPILFREALDS